MTVVDVLVVPELSDAEQSELERLLRVWKSKRASNLLLLEYCDAHRHFKNLGIAVPPSMSRVRAALDWPSKAIQARVRKHQFDGVSLGGDLDPMGLGRVFDQNRFDVELSYAFGSMYTHGFALLSVVRGGPAGVVISAHSADACSVALDPVTRTVRSAVTVAETDDDGQPVRVVLFTRDSTVTIVRGLGKWRVESRDSHGSGSAQVEVLVNAPRIDRPLGRSVITREVRYLTDAAIRTLVRGEVSAEFFASPQRYVLGASEDAFKDKDRWSAITGRVLGLSRDEEGELPQVGQFPQMTMSPHWEMYRQLAQNFCAATSLPQSSVGIYADNPASAEAMQAAEAQLSEDVEFQWRLAAPAIRGVAQNVLMLRDGVSADGLPDDAWGLSVNWTPARYVSPQASSDWAVKAAAADPSLAGTTVMLRRLGLSEGEIEEVRSEKRRAAAGSVLDRLAGGGRDYQGGRDAVAAGDAAGGGAGEG